MILPVVCFLTLPIGISSRVALAQVPGAEELLFQEIPVVITASLREQKISQAPAPMNVISGDEIKARGYRTLKDMIVDIPGWEDTSDANEITAAVRGVYSSTTNKILIMINGHRMNDLNLGRYNLDQFLGINIIERVEFIKGPGSVLYGNGALAGVVNIITKKGADLKGTYLDNKVTFYGSKMDYESSITWGQQKDKLDALLNFTYLDAKGDEIHQPAFLEKVPAGKTQQDGVIYYNKYPDNYSFFGSLDYDNMRLDVRREHYSRAVPRAPNLSFYDYNDEPVKPNYEEDITYLDFKYTAALSATSKLTLNPGVTFYRLNELSFINTYGANFLPPDGTRSGQRTRYEQYQLKANYENQLRDNVNVIFGVDSLISKFRDMYGITGTTGAPFVETQSDEGGWALVGGFGQLTWSPMKRLELTFSGRYDTFGNFADPNFSKRFGAVYKLIEGLNAKVLYGESFLSPQWAHMKQVTASSVFNPDPSLQPETFTGWDFILELNRGKTYLNLDFFRNNLKNLITSATGSSFAYSNSGENTYQGFELEGKYALLKQLGLEGSYSYVKNEGNTSDTSLLFGSIKNIPTSIYRLGLKYSPLKNFDIRIWGRAYSEVRTSDAITGENRIKPWATMDMSINYKLSAWDFQFGITNFFDKYYELGGTVNRPLARPGRGIWFSTGYKF